MRITALNYLEHDWWIKSDHQETPVNHTFTHPDLTGFSFNYPSDWQVGIKPREAADWGGLPPLNGDESSRCGAGCLGISVSRDDVALQIAFQPTLGFGRGPICSSKVTYTPVDAHWHRINSGNPLFNTAAGEGAGAYYTADILESAKDTTNDFKSYWERGSPEDNWSYLPDTTYDFCLVPVMKYLSATEHDDIEGVAMIIDPQIVGNPSPEELEQIDDIVRSFQGLE